MEQQETRRRVLLSAYACEPGKGSEPGVGWRWSNGMADRVKLTVLTRSNNRPAIDEAIALAPTDASIHEARFVYHDLPAWVLWLKRKRFLPASVYYVLWQWSATHRYRQLGEASDIVHHLTFCNLLCPGFWRLKSSSLVIGPVGAPIVPRQYLRLFGAGCIVQAIRGITIRHFNYLPWLRYTLKGAKAIIPANSSVKELLGNAGYETEKVLLDTGAPEMAMSSMRKDHGHSPLRFVFAGILERRKGLELSLRAFAEVSRRLGPEQKRQWEFVIIGDGPDFSRLKRLARRMGMGAQVRFLGKLSHKDTLDKIAEADIFLFTSVRDTSAGVNLEAMACGLPVICLAHQGVADITADDCAIRVPVLDYRNTIRELADAIIFSLHSPQMICKMSEAAERRARKDFSWEEKFSTMQVIYERIANR